MRGAILSVVSIACGLIAVGCVAPPSAQRGHALYPAATPRPPLDQVARLSLVSLVASPRIGATAIIKSVDGRRVGSVDTAFELLPGCHVIEVEHTPYFRSVRPGGTDFRGQGGTRVFPLRMKAGHEYAIVLRFETDSFIHVSAHGVETDPSGAQVQVIAEASSPRDVQACSGWTSPPG